MDDLDIAHNRIGESAQRVVDRAIDEARRRGHAEFTSAHLFLAFGRVEWDTFAESMRDLDLNPHEVLKAIEDSVQAQPPARGETAELRASNAAKLVLRSAFHHASRAGRQAIESADLVAGILDQSQEAPVMIVRRHGVEPDALVARVATHFRDSELREEQLRKRFELPAALKNFAVNLNLLARQDKIAPVDRPRSRDPAGARDPVPPRTIELGDADRRAGRRQDGDRRRAGAAHRDGAGNGAGAAARLPHRQPADERGGGRHHAARHVRGAGPRGDQGNQGASEPDPVRGRSPHAGRRRLGDRCAGRCRQHLQVGARARRGADDRRHDDERVQVRTSRKTRRWRAASGRWWCPSPPSTTRAAS